MNKSKTKSRNKSQNKRQSRIRSVTRKNRSNSNVIKSRNTNINRPGEKKHIKTKIQGHMKPTGTRSVITNSYMNKKGIIRHTKSKNIYPYVPPILQNL